MKTINIKGKNYVQVNERVKALRETATYNGWSIITDVHTLTDDVCVMCAKVLDKDGHVRATGWAREVRNDQASMVNKTSYVENCETSAVGRALGFVGIGIDENICSAEEMQNALQAEESLKAKPEPKTAPAAPVTQKGNVISPDDKKAADAPKKPEKTDNLTCEELGQIYDSLDDVQFGKYNAACNEMLKAKTRNELNSIYDRHRLEIYAPLLIDFGMQRVKEKGL